MTHPRKLSPRKLLVAAIGVATVNYVAAVACTPPTSGNLPSPRPETDASSSTPHNIPPTSGNLPSPRPETDAAPPSIVAPTSGNLPAPVPRDAGPR